MSWLDEYEIDDTLKSDKSLEPIKDVPNLIKGFVNLSHLMGKSVRIPDASSTPEDRQKFYDKLRPATAKDYKLNIDIPKDIYQDEAFLDWFKTISYEAGLTQEQVQLFSDRWHKDQVIPAYEGTKKAKEEAVSALKKEWGGKYDENYGKARQIAEKLGGGELVELLDEAPNNLIKAFSQMGSMTSSDTLVTGQPAGGQLSPDMAERKYTEIMSNFEHPYNKAEHPGHAEAVKEVEGLLKTAHPAKKE